MQTEVTAKHSRRKVMWLTLVGLLVLAVVAIGCHRSIERHQASIHSPTDYEDYCIDTQASALDLVDAQIFLGRTLYADNQDTDWDKIDGTENIFWIPRTQYFNDCGQMPFQTWIEFKYIDGGVGGFSQVSHSSRICEPPAETHCHYQNELVVLNGYFLDGETGETYPGGTPKYDNLARHTINHETGHILGLLDPYIPGTAVPAIPCVACGIVSDVDSRCSGCFDGFITCLFEDPIANLVWWIRSVMHSNYYCGDEENSFGVLEAFSLTWPEPADRDKVIDIIEEYP